MRVLVVEDESRLAALVHHALSEEGIASDIAATGNDASDWLAVARYDAIILDLMLPGMDGIELCRSIRRRENQTPILMLTAKDTISDRVTGLDAGADDYLVKPFAMAELLARLRALVRRPASFAGTVLSVAGLRLDPATRHVESGGAPVELSNKQFRLLEYLMRNPDRVLTRSMIADHVWGYDFPSVTNVIDVHIRALRNAIGDPYPGRRIQTVRGVSVELRAVSAKLPIRWRLTLLYGGALAIALLLFGLLLYAGLRFLLYEDFEERVHAQAALAAAAVQSDVAGISIDAGALQRWQDDDNFVRLFSLHGEIIQNTSTTFGEVPIDSSAIDTAQAGGASYSIEKGGSEPLGIVTAPIRDGGAITGIVQVGMSRSDVDEVLKLLLIALAIAAPIVIGAAAAGGYFLAGRALQPVDSITSLASRLGADDLTSRLELDLPDDELGRLATTFNAMLDRIENAFERQRRFTGDAAHELRTPLSTMQSEIELTLSRSRSPQEYQAALQEVQIDAERLSGIVRALLMLARAGAGALTVEMEPFALDAMMHTVLDQYRDLCRDAGIRVHEEIAPASITADEDLIVQLLVNLLDNAVAHTPPGREITMGNRLEPGTLRIWVSNSGPGIPTEDLPHLFEPFYRVDTGRARQTGGIGLGLAICKAIVDAHDGSIAISSEAESTTRVDVTLPLIY